MRFLLLTSSILLAPALAAASPQCTIPPGPWTAERPTLPVPVAASTVEEPKTAPAGPPVTVPDASALPPVLKRVKDAGAQLTELGSAHGLRSVVARNGTEFRFLHVAPDGNALVGGLVSELTPERLASASAGQVKELGIVHGLRTLFVSSGPQFQVFYVTPDGERVIPGAMWDASGHNVTRDQVARIDGTVATVEVAPGAKGVPVDAAASPAAQLAAVGEASTGVYGDPGAPKLYMFIDPMCSFSVRAMQQLQPLVAAKRLQVAVIPVAILDHEDGGRSTTSALSMLSVPPGQMVPAWASGHLDGPAAPDAPAKLAGNRTVSELVSLRGTPMLIWRMADGSVGRSDGMPADLNALLASIGR